MSRRPLALTALSLALLFLTLTPLFTFARAPDEPAGGETPTVLANWVDDITLQEQKVWLWHGSCVVGNEPSLGPTFKEEEISRIAETGGITRTIFAQDPPNPLCGAWSPDVISPIGADNNFVWWVSDAANGLVKLATTANVGDAPIPVYTGQADADDLAEHGNLVYLLDDAYGLIRVNKTTGVGDPLRNTAQIGTNARQIQATPLYSAWIGSNQLRLFNNITSAAPVVGSDVQAIFPERSRCPDTGSCAIPNNIFLSEGGRLRRYDVDSNTLHPYLYFTPDPGGVVTEVVVDENYMYFFERRLLTCDPFCIYRYGLYRHPRNGGGTTETDLLYTYPFDGYEGQEFGLHLGGPNNSYLFWRDNSQLVRLPRDAAAIPEIDLDVVAIEVSQGIQSLENDVNLIKDKRTGVRVHAVAVGTLFTHVDGVTAHLYRVNSSNQIIAGPLLPMQNTNWIRIHSLPIRNIFEGSFYYELPNDWVNDSSLILRAEVNPIRLPAEPGYANNTMQTRLFTMRESPTMRVQMFMWGYYIGGTLHYPSERVDGLQTQSWIRRIYPVASTPGGYEDPGPGLRADMRYIYDDRMGREVMHTSDDCRDRDVDDRAFCAADMANSFNFRVRIAEGIPLSHRLYGMIPRPTGGPSLRGYASDFWNHASGRAERGPAWDTDGTMADHYMGHELAHTYDRWHPSEANWCGHSADDDDFPYANASIGDESMWGFDVGELGLTNRLPPRVYPSNLWTDNMAYCERRWFSDYTVNGIYGDMTREASMGPEYDPPPARSGSDWLAIAGTISDENSAEVRFDSVTLWDSPGPYTPPTGTQYTLRLLDGAGAVLSTHTFDGDGEDEFGFVPFGVVVPFDDRAVRLEVRHAATNTLLGEYLFSTNAPTVANVQLIGAPNPVTGTVTISWDGNDADGDPLTYDIYYSPDEGVSWEAHAIGIISETFALDTARMGGSTTARLRVIANDGARQGEAESATFTMAPKPPTIYFLNPQDGLEVRWQTLINFSVDVIDVQGSVAPENVRYYINGVPHTEPGYLFSTDALPVGTHTIEVRATNSAGITGSASITVIVNDEVGYPDANFAVGPDLVGWHVAEGSTAPLTATLNIVNTGTGDLTWTATEDSEWLSLNISDGGTPLTISLTADPTQVSSNTTAETVVTFTASNGQTIEVPVSLTVGLSPEWFPPVEWQLHLPLVGRAQ
jgi:hypothetical protein